MAASVQYRLVAPGVHCAAVPMPPPLYSANAYLLSDGGEAVLVDTGWVRGGDWSHIPTMLDRAGVARGEVRAVAATHGHVDHVGHVPDVRHALDAPLLMHPLEAATRTWARPGERDELTAWLASHAVPAGYLDDAVSALDAMAPPALDPWPLVEGGAVAVGSTIWRVVHTPGHTPGHLCLFREGDRILIGGDHLLEKVSPNVSGLPGQPADPLGSYLRALRRVADLHPTLVLPGHGPPFSDVELIVSTSEAHHARRLSQVCAALSAGRLSTFGVANAISWAGGGRRFGELEGAHRFLAFGETLAHLERLACRGDVQRNRSEGTDTWALR